MLPVSSGRYSPRIRSMTISPFGWRHWLAARFFFPLLAVSVLAMTLFAGWHLLNGPWDGPATKGDVHLWATKGGANGPRRPRACRWRRRDSGRPPGGTERTGGGRALPGAGFVGAPGGGRALSLSQRIQLCGLTAVFSRATI